MTDCLREVLAATRMGKPLVLVHEHDEKKGGAPLEELKAECPAELRDATFATDVEIVRWHRLIDLQDAALKRVAMAMLKSLTPDAPNKLYLPSCVTEANIVLSKPVRVYVSPHNTGVTRVAEMLLKVAEASTITRHASSRTLGHAVRAAEHAIEHAFSKHSASSIRREDAPPSLNRSSSSAQETDRDSQAGPEARTYKYKLRRLHCGEMVTSSSLVEATHMLLYLNRDTWEVSQPEDALQAPRVVDGDGDNGQSRRRRGQWPSLLETAVAEPRIAAEVRRARQLQVPILMVHERALEHGGCLFDRFLLRTPPDLVTGGLYNDLAPALFPSPEETEVALAQLYMKVAQTERLVATKALPAATVPKLHGSVRARFRRIASRKLGLAPSSVVVQGSIQSSGQKV